MNCDGDVKRTRYPLMGSTARYEKLGAGRRRRKWQSKQRAVEQEEATVTRKAKTSRGLSSFLHRMTRVEHNGPNMHNNLLHRRTLHPRNRLDRLLEVCNTGKGQSLDEAEYEVRETNRR
jgi:hypothetical protein